MNVKTCSLVMDGRDEDKARDDKKALPERQKCITKLASAGEILPEVLMSLPSLDEIARRADEAKAKAQAALQK